MQIEMRILRNPALALAFAVAHACPPFQTGLLGQQLGAPVAGVLADSGRLQLVEGVAGSFALGTHLRGDISAAEWAGGAVAERVRRVAER